MPVSDENSWKKRLRQERVLRNWRQSDVAEQLDVSVVTVQRWEKGSQQPGAYFRLKLCTLFGKSAEELGIVDPPSSLPADNSTSEQPENISPVHHFTLWNVPYQRNPHFTGREELLDLLQQQLHPQSQTEPTLTRRTMPTQVLKGLGGAGKTQIAVEYAYRAQQQGFYTHILWINAANEEAVLTSFVALAHRLPGGPPQSETNQRKLVAAVKVWLEESIQPWLLIVDNADELSMIQEYLPQRGNGSLLLTTRAHAVGALANSLEVEAMNQLEGLQLLLSRAQRQKVSVKERSEAMDVVKVLGGFPLALDQAGAYIEETGCSFSSYFQIYQQHHRELLARRGKQASNYPDPVATTWTLSFKKVEQVSPAAAELLRLVAFLAPDRIPEELLTGGAMHWPPVLQKGVADLFSFNQLVEALLAFSLVKRQAQEHILSTHRLVQVVQRDALEAEEQRQWAERVVRAVNTVFPTDTYNNVANWPLCLCYLEQAQACDGLIQQYQLLFPEAAEVLDRTSLYLAAHASYTLAESLCQRALWIWEQLSGIEHPGMAISLNILANIYLEQGKYTEAEPLIKRALHIRKQQPGPEDIQVASLFHNLALLYNRQGKHMEAETLYQQALRIWEQRLGPEHPDLISSINNLAIFYRVQGRYAEAETLHQRALCITEKQLGPEHYKAAYPINGLANLHMEQGRYAEAEQLYQRALRIWEQHFGPEHPGLAYPLNNLAELCTRQGRYAEAELLCQRALSIREQRLGPEHPDVALSLNGLANLALQQGRYTAVAPLYQRALRIRERASGPFHHQTAEILYNFASFQEAQGNFQESASLYRRALETHEHVYGPQHPKTDKIRTRLHSVLLALGEADEVAWHESNIFV